MMFFAPHNALHSLDPPFIPLHYFFLCFVGANSAPPCHPFGALEGLKLSIVGTTVKSEVLVTEPDAIILIFPVVALLGTVAMICVEEFTVKELTLTPLIVTEVAPVKPVPVIVTKEPPVPLAGVKLVMVGTANADPVKPIRMSVIIRENCINRFIGNPIQR